MMMLSNVSKTRWRLWRSNKIQDDCLSEIPLCCVAETTYLKFKSNTSDENSKFEAKESEGCLSDHNKKKTRSFVLDPRGPSALRWNVVFFIASMISLFVDPAFLLLPEVRQDFCIQLGEPLKAILTVIRSGVDLFYVINFLVQFRMAYIAPSRVIGRGELVTEPSKIATRYLSFGFWINLTAALPVPQVFIWVILPNLSGSTISRFRTYVFVLTIHMLQMFLRFWLVYPLSLQLCKASGVITETAWLGAAYTLLFYLFACFVAGNCWYIQSIQRVKQCWDMVCNQEDACIHSYLECSALGDPSRAHWLQLSNITEVCDPDNDLFPYGIYDVTITQSLATDGFFNKFFFCLWWGLRNLSSQGENLDTSIDVVENMFTLMVATVGVSLFGLSVVIMQKYIQSEKGNLEKWRLKQTDLERWMHHRKLPRDLRESITEYYNYKWVATQGVNEEAILNALPINLKRQTKKYLCLNLLKQVPLFGKLDDQTLSAICERLKPTLYTKDMDLLCEGEPVNEMFFIMRGHLYSYTTDGGRIGFFNSSKLGPNGFCGEELLTWVLDKRASNTLPRSTRTVRTISEVEGFVLEAKDLKFITTQFRRMQSRELRDSLRFYSQQWRTWAACFIQAAWKRYKRNKYRLNGHETLENDNQQEQTDHQNHGCLSSRFDTGGYGDMEVFVPRPDAGIEVYAARLLADRRSVSHRFG